MTARSTSTIHVAFNDTDASSDRVKAFDSTVGNSMKLIDQMQGNLRANNIGLQEHAATRTDADLAKSITDLNLTNQPLNR